MCNSNAGFCQSSRWRVQACVNAWPPVTGTRILRWLLAGFLRLPFARKLCNRPPKRSAAGRRKESKWWSNHLFCRLLRQRYTAPGTWIDRVRMIWNSFWQIWVQYKGKENEKQILNFFSTSQSIWKNLMPRIMGKNTKMNLVDAVRSRVVLGGRLREGAVTERVWRRYTEFIRRIRGDGVDQLSFFTWV